MIDLGTKYTKHGITHEVIRKEGDICMAIEIPKAGSCPNRKPSYEVFRIRHLKDVVIGKNLKKGGPSVPKPSEWGEDAFTCITTERAEFRFNQLTERHANKQASRAKPLKLAS